MFFTHSFSYILPLISVASSFPTESARGLLTRRNATDCGAYYGISSAEHKNRTTSLKELGCRVKSLSVYGAPPEVKYAAVWTKAEGSGFETIADANEDAYTSWYADLRSRGYVSTHVTATGPGESAVFAGVMEQADVYEKTVCGMSSPFAYQNATGGVDMFVKGYSVYGTPDDRRYCIVGHENTGYKQQTVFYQTQATKDSYETTYNAETSKRFWRPTFLDVTSDQLISPAFDDSSVGKWSSKVGLTESALEAEIEAQAANGLSLAHISGGGELNVSYAVIFTEHATTLPREWAAKGDFTGFEDNAAVASDLDSTMRYWMETNGVRQAQVAIAREGKLIGARAFTLAESDRAVIEPTDKMLLGSVSKMFTHGATQRLIDDGLLNLTTKVYPLLGIKPTDEEANDITVEHLIRNMAGYDRSKSRDPSTMFRDLAIMKNTTEPQTLRDIIDWVATQPLDYSPGGQYVYSNYATMLLSYVVTNLTGTPYTDYLKERVLEDGLEAELFTTAAKDHVNDPVSQETRLTGPSPLTPLENHQVPAMNGGDGDIKEEVVGSFGLKATAATVARFIGKNAVWTMGGREPMSNRDGSIAGARSFAQSMGQENFDWVVILNTREYSSEEAWSNLIYYQIPPVWAAHNITGA